MRAAWTIPLFCLGLTSCGGNPSGDVAGALGTFTAPFVAVDLTTGALESHAEISEDDLRTDARWKQTKLLFRRIEIGGIIGVSGTALGADSDEPSPREVAPAVLFIAVFELTQAQWIALGGQARWLEPGLRAAGGGVVAAGAPAYGLSRDEVLTALGAFNAGHEHRLALPSHEQWEVACRGGISGTLFWWGDDPRAANIGTSLRAVVAETVAATGDGVVGPRAVDLGRSANPVGLYDLHGNLWEWVDSVSGTVRGGSWNDSVPLARAANRLGLDQAVHHPLVGARLILVP